MNMQQRKQWYEGKQLWSEYVRVNGYSFKPTKDGLKKLARLLDLKPSYLAHNINMYLEN